MSVHVGFFLSSRRRHTRWPRDWSSRRVLFRSQYRLEQLLRHLPEPYDAVPEASSRESERAFPDAPGYLMVLNFSDDTVEARLRDPYGAKVAPRRVRELLTVVRQNLI